MDSFVKSLALIISKKEYQILIVPRERPGGVQTRTRVDHANPHSPLFWIVPQACDDNPSEIGCPLCKLFLVSGTSTLNAKAGSTMNFVEFIKEYYGVTPKLSDRYGEWLGYSISMVDKNLGKVVTNLTIRDDHLSPSGAVHGGVISGFLDFSCGCAVFSTLNKGQLCSTVELNVKYFKPLKSGDQIIAEAEVLSRGNSLCSVLAKIYKQENNRKPIALATGTFNIYQPRKP